MRSVVRSRERGREEVVKGNRGGSVQGNERCIRRDVGRRKREREEMWKAPEKGCLLKLGIGEKGGREKERGDFGTAFLE